MIILYKVLKCAVKYDKLVLVLHFLLIINSFLINFNISHPGLRDIQMKD